MNKAKNYSELRQFLEANEKRTRDKTNKYAFKANVTYRKDSKSKTFQTDVRLEADRYLDPEVRLTETDQCPISEYPLDFKPKFNAMKFDRELNILVINCECTKRGAFIVIIDAL